MSIVLLTRPREQSEEFSLKFTPAINDAKIIIDPVVSIIGFSLAGSDIPKADVIIFTSARGLDHLPEMSDAQPSRAFVVGEKTGQAARRSGFQPEIIAQTQDAMIEEIKTMSFEPLSILFAHGQPVTGNLGSALKNLGHEVHNICLYRQESEALTQETLNAIDNVEPLIPVFSTNAAKSLAQTLPAPINQPWHFLAISEDVGDAIKTLFGCKAEIAKSPNAAEMINLLQKRLQDAKRTS